MRYLLRHAFGLIRKSRFDYRLDAGTVTNDFGQKVPSYGEWIPATGIVEPGLVSSFGSKNLQEISYKDLGLDPSRKTITVWLEYSGIGTTADGSTCDQIRWNGRIYNVLRIEDWLEYDGWKRAYCQEIQNEGGFAP